MFNKYIKYKKKYLNLKVQTGGIFPRQEGKGKEVKEGVEEEEEEGGRVESRIARGYGGGEYEMSTNVMHSDGSRL